MSKFGCNTQMNMIVIKVGSKQDESCKLRHNHEFLYVLKGIEKRIKQKAVRYTR